MLNQNKLDSQSINNANSFNLKKTISIYLKQWKWFALSCALCACFAFFYIRYTTPEYVAYAKIMLIDENTGNSPNSALNDLLLFSKSEDAKVEDEIQAITSREFLKTIVKKLGINLSFYTKGRIYESELYKNTPVNVSFIASDSIVDRTNFNFYLNIISETKFDYKTEEDGESKQYAFGETIPTFFGEMIITPKNENITHAIGNNMRVMLSPITAVAEDLKHNISISPSGESSKVLDIYLQDPLVDKAKDIINTLIDEYNKASIEQKNALSKKTAEFINERVELIASDLVNVDDSIVRFKTGNKITNVASDTGQFLQSSAQNQEQMNASKTQMDILDYVSESLDVNSDSFEPINVIGIGDPSVDALSLKYNEILAQRQNLLKSAGEKNATVQELNQSLNSIQQSLKSNIESSRQSLAIKINSLENQSNRINSKIYSVPGQEKKLRSIERKQGVKESLYLYLLQKREETTISLAATSPSSKVIDEAYSTNLPVLPNKKIIYIASIFIGFLMPFGFIYVKDLLDDKIHNKEDLENEIKSIPILGEIPKLKSGSADIVIKRNDRSLLSESFRIIRTNLDYITKGRDVKEYNNVIFVTSTINGEGKSFFSLNMALTLANTDKRVLLIGADIRNPKITLSEKTSESKNKLVSKIGLTEYLVDKSILIGEAINTYEVNGNHIDVMLSGKIPPNPAELLMNNKMKMLFDKVSEQYDYVIVDTAPAMLVTDTLLFSQYAGHTIYMTRAGYTENRILNFAKELHNDNRLKGMMLVVNDVDQSSLGYGAKYGYYGAAEKKSWFSRKNKI